MSGNLATEERLTWLRSRLSEEGRVRIADAAGVLGVSEMTVRRDLHELESAGVARRVRGGAVAVGPVTIGERSRARAKAKARIAAKLHPVLPDVGVLGVDASTTVARVVAGLDNVRDLTVVTNGVSTFQSLLGRPGITPMITGGSFDERTSSLVGPLALRSAASVLLSALVISAAAVDAELGPSEESLEECEVKRAFAAVSEQVFLAVDSSKLGHRAMAPALPWERITMLVTELDPTDTRLDPFRDRVVLL